PPAPLQQMTVPPSIRPPEPRKLIPAPPKLPTQVPPPSALTPTPSSLEFAELPEWTTDTGARTNPENRLAQSPATTQPMAPAAPIAPPTAPTLVAIAGDFAASSTARGLAGPTIIAEPSPSSTSRGFPPPQSQPIPAAPPRPAPVLLEVTPRGLG